VVEIQDARNRHFGTIAQLYRAISSEQSHVSTIGKKLLNIDTSSTCPDNMVNFGLLTAAIRWRRCKFQRISRLGSVTVRHSSSGRQPNFVALNRGLRLYSAGRPWRWALAHISSFLSFIPSDIAFYSLYFSLAYFIVRRPWKSDGGAIANDWLIDYPPA